MEKWEFYLTSVSNLNSKILKPMSQVTLGFVNHTSMTFQMFLPWESIFHMLFKFIQDLTRFQIESYKSFPFCFIALADSKTNFALSEINVKLCSKNPIKLVLWKDSIPLQFFFVCGCDLDLKVSLH